VAVRRQHEVGIDELLRATWWQMPGRHAIDGTVVADAGPRRERALQLAQPLDLVGEPRHRRHAGRVDQVIFEHGELRWIGQLVVRAVLRGEEEVDLRRGELVRVAGVHLDEHRVARLDVRALAGEELGREDLLGQVHRPRAGAVAGTGSPFEAAQTGSRPSMIRCVIAS
jgi:hypothetical protein